MKYEVSQAIIQQTIQCDKDFACLKPGNHPGCSIKECINDQVHFVAKHSRYCPYGLSFGNEVICSCPVRKELYNRYKI